MRNKLLILFTLLSIQESLAQFNKRNVLLGGGFGFTAAQNNTGISVSPNIHYFLTDNLTIGGSLNLGTNRDNPGEDLYNRTNSLGISPAVRYFLDLGENVFIYGQGTLGLRSSNTTFVDGNERTDVQSFSGFALGLSPGIIYRPTDKIGFDVNFNFLSFTRTGITNEVADPTTTNVRTDFSFGFNSFNPSFGIYYIIGNK